MECSGKLRIRSTFILLWFPQRNHKPTFSTYEIFRLENIYQYVIALNLFVNGDLFDVLCIIIAIVGHKCELCKSTKINGALSPKYLAIYFTHIHY